MVSSVSIVVPVYNVSVEYFEEAVRSCVTQTWGGNLELVVVDDASSRNNHERYRFILDIAKRDLPVRFIRHPAKLGLAAARNSGLGAARGEVAVLLDSDDVLSASCIASVAMKFENPELALIFTDHEKRTSDLSEQIHVRRKAVFANLLKEYAGTIWDPFLHSTFLIHCHGLRLTAIPPSPFDTSVGIGDEVKLHIDISRAGSQRVGHVPEILYTYRDNPRGICNSNQYPQLISNIERVLAGEMRARTGYDIRARKMGRCSATAAALYVHEWAGGRIEAPYIDYEGGRVKGDRLRIQPVPLSCSRLKEIP